MANVSAAPTVERVISLYGTVARRKDLTAVGITSWQISRALSDGRIQLVAPGYYGLPRANAIDVMLAKLKGGRSCLSEAKRRGLWVIEEPERVHIAVHHGHPVPGCVVHRIRGRQSLMDVLHQCVKCGSELEALCVLESAIVLKRCTFAQLRRSFAGRQDAAGRAIISMIDPQSQSIVETIARYLIRQAGFNVQSQFFVKGVGHLDLLVDGVLAVETDGETYHNTGDGWTEDLRRDNLLVLNGLWCLRIPARMVLDNPETMLKWVQQALTIIDAKPR
ncbi:endonuclease domain-containing protein [Arthrobacter sp. A2-55]|uniref:endonuclease domain-containing protein n=1 Tax=Arthrobacter sp. A2-55 TaxID=2897337 RepID=UPI0021CD7BCA|nr:hypothetical protein [Arthrobacter sp. A2-55]MCU6479881.1 hypothetical protein [Arthrobacter sp. A2-55]